MPGYSSSTGTIADLMRQKGRVSADAVRGQGEAEAASAMVGGNAWGNAIQNIGQTVSGSLRDLAQHRQDAPNRELRQRQSDMLAKELSAMDTASAQAEIGRLAGMVKASGYDPNTAEPIFRAIGRITPDYEEPLLRSLMEPEKLRGVTDALLSQVPGYKAPEGFTLTEGQRRFGPDGQEIASVSKPEPVAQPFTLSPGAKRFNPDGSLAAEVPAAQPSVSLRPEDVLLDGRPAKAIFNPSTGTFSVGGQDVTARVKPIPQQGPAPERPSVWVSNKDGQQQFVTPTKAASLSSQGWGPSQTRENPTEDERKTAGFFKRMENAIKVIDEVEDQISQADLYQIQSLPQEDLMGLLNRGKMSEPAKRYIRAMMQFTEARLRADSGAAVQPYEYVSDRQIHGKTYGETADLRTDRRNARTIALDGLKTRGGRALPKTAPTDDGRVYYDANGNQIKKP